MKKHVLINIHGNLPEKNRPVVGNGIRAFTMGSALSRSGMKVSYITHCSFYNNYAIPDNVLIYSDDSEFIQKVKEINPDLFICIQGEGLEKIPNSNFDIPILADWIAPRMLEFAYQNLPLDQWFSKVVSNASKADYHSCSTPYQRAYLYFLLQVAGVDIRKKNIYLIPLSTSTDFAERIAHPNGPVFVTGGVNWPWIKMTRFLSLLIEEMERAGRGKIKIFGGKYPFSTDSEIYSDSLNGISKSRYVEYKGMLPYEDLINEYLSADIAYDLFEENPERQLAFSFREIDYLKAGLPIICTNFSYISSFISKYKAGWIIDVNNEKQIRETVRSILNSDTIPLNFSRNARKIIKRHFDINENIKPILEILKSPEKYKSGDSFFKTTLLWSDFARTRLEKEEIKIKVLEKEIESLKKHLENYRELEVKKERDLASSSATIKQLEQYISKKEKELKEMIALLDEKDIILGRMEAEKNSMEAEKNKMAKEIDHLIRKKDELAKSLQNIQSKLLYRIYKKIFGE